MSDHKQMMVLHDHQANPHVLISVRAESKHGRRLNPRTTDLHRWRETFAEKLRERGVEAKATRQATHGATRIHPHLWQVKAAEQGRLLLPPRSGQRRGAAVAATRAEAQRAWQSIGAMLAKSVDPDDRKLAAAIERFSRTMTPSGQRAPAAPTLNRPGSEVNRSQ